MDVNVFYQTLDDLFKNNELTQVEPFLNASLDEAREESDYNAYISICNEMIGYFRSVSQFDKAYKASEDVLLLMEELKLEDTEHFATVLLNSATAFRAGGRVKDAYEQYMRALRIYEGLLEPGDYRFAGLYNNMCMLLQAMNENEKAALMAEKALEIIHNCGDARMEEATTMTNLALIYFALQRHEEAKTLLEQAIAVFESDGEQTDAHYSGALAGIGEAYYHMEDYAQALVYYEKAAAEVKKHFGENQSYAILSENCAAVCDRLEDAEKAAYYRDAAAKTYEKLGIKD